MNDERAEENGRELGDKTKAVLGGEHTMPLGLRILAKAALIGAIALALSPVALIFRLLGVL